MCSWLSARGWCRATFLAPKFQEPQRATCPKEEAERVEEQPGDTATDLNAMKARKKGHCTILMRKAVRHTDTNMILLLKLCIFLGQVKFIVLRRKVPKET